MGESPLINVMLVTGRDPVSDWLISTLRSEAGVMLVSAVPTLERAAPMIGQQKIDVVLIDSDVPDAHQLERLQAIAALPMSPAVILIVTPVEMAFVQQAMFAGARGFLLKPFTHQQLMESLQQTYGILSQQRQAITTTVAVAMPPPTESAEVFALFSPKGGVGRTSVAANLAIALQAESRKPVTLVDGDLRFGDLDIALNLIARKSIADLLPYVDELDASLVESALIDHPSGIHVLLAPPYFDPEVESDEGRLAHVVKTLATGQNGFVIVDAPADLGESTLNLLDLARRVLLVTTASVATLRAAKRFLELARKMNYPSDKILMILSGYRKDDISIEDIEYHLGWPVTATVPSDPAAMALALNQGQPIVARDRNHPISKAILKLARYLGSTPASSAPQPSSAESSSGSPDHQAASPLFRLKPGQVLGS